MMTPARGKGHKKCPPNIRETVNPLVFLFAMPSVIHPISEEAPTRQTLSNEHNKQLMIASVSVFVVLFAHCSRTLTTKLCRPFRAPLDVLLTDSWPCTFDRFHEVLQREWRLKQLVRVHLSPRHFHRPSVPRRARSQFLFVINGDLMCSRKLHFPYDLSCQKLYLFIMCGGLDLPYRLHERVLYRDADITARITFTDLAKGLEV